MASDKKITMAMKFDIEDFHYGWIDDDNWAIYYRVKVETAVGGADPTYSVDYRVFGTVDTEEKAIELVKLLKANMEGNAISKNTTVTVE